MPHHLGNADTAWLFLSDSNEPRHLYDVVFAVDVLRGRGVPETAIHVFTADPAAASAHISPYGLTATPLGDFLASATTLTGFTGAVLTVTGHGQHTGLGNGLTPAAIVGGVRSIPSLQIGVLVLCQCYGGIFNFADATATPQLVIMGATNLNLSISAGVHLSAPINQTDGANGIQGWDANLFLFHFYDWLRNPRDVDGDGLITIVDGYKLAGIGSNHVLAQLKGALFVQAGAQAASLRSLTQKMPPAPKIQIDAAETALRSTLMSLHLHQEPWILHGKLAREVTV